MQCSFRLAFLILLLFSLPLSLSGKEGDRFEQKWIRKGLVINDRSRKNTRFLIGPIGVTCLLTDWKTAIISFDPPQGSPAQKGDIIIGANGKKFRLAAIQEIGLALEESEGGKKGKFTLEILRDNTPMTLRFDVGDLGYYSDTFPYNCKKSEKQYEEICAWIAKRQHANGSFPGSRALSVSTCSAGLCLLNNYEKYKKEVDKAFEYTLADVRKKGYASGKGTFRNWNLTFSIIFLCEYNIAQGIKPELTKELEILHDVLFSYRFQGRGQRFDDGYGHGPGGYVLGMANGLVACSYALMKEAGVDVSQGADNFFAYMDTRGMGKSGGVWYGGTGQGFGRTGMAALGYQINGDKKWIAKTGEWLSRSAPTEYFQTHAFTQEGKCMGLLGLAATNPAGFREVMDGFKWDFPSSRRPDGTFDLSNKPFTAQYWGGWKTESVIGPLQASWIGLVLGLYKKNLMITGKESRYGRLITIDGIVSAELSPELQATFIQIRKGRFNTAAKALIGLTGPAEKMMAYINGQAKLNIDALTRLEKNGEWFHLKTELAKMKENYGGIAIFDQKAQALEQEFLTKSGRDLVKAHEQFADAAYGPATVILDSLISYSENETHTELAKILKARAIVKTEAVLDSYEQLKNTGHWGTLNESLNKSEKRLAGVEGYDEKHEAFASLMKSPIGLAMIRAEKMMLNHKNGKLKFKEKEIAALMRVGKKYFQLEKAWKRRQSQFDRRNIERFISAYGTTLYGKEAKKLLAK